MKKCKFYIGFSADFENGFVLPGCECGWTGEKESFKHPDFKFSDMVESLREQWERHAQETKKPLTGLNCS